jgi:hypothetical protein
MIVALLAVLGVDLIVIVVPLGVMLTRQRWVDRQPGASTGGRHGASSYPGVIKWLGTTA